jgi:hypothetical protein
VRLGLLDYVHCNVVDGYQRFGETLKMEAKRPSETPVTACKTTKNQNPENHAVAALNWLPEIRMRDEIHLCASTAISLLFKC